MLGIVSSIRDNRINRFPFSCMYLYMRFCMYLCVCTDLLGLDALSIGGEGGGGAKAEANSGAGNDWVSF